MTQYLCEIVCGVVIQKSTSRCLFGCTHVSLIHTALYMYMNFSLQKFRFVAQNLNKNENIDSIGHNLHKHIEYQIRFFRFCTQLFNS